MYQTDVYRRIVELIPKELLDKYPGHSFAELAGLPEFEEWAKELLQAEIDWFAAEDA